MSLESNTGNMSGHKIDELEELDASISEGTFVFYRYTLIYKFSLQLLTFLFPYRNLNSLVCYAKAI
jgi:hypothetical protein